MTSYTYDDLMKKTIVELRDISNNLGVDITSKRLKSEIAFAIAQFAHVQKIAEENAEAEIHTRNNGNEAIEVTGVLDVMSDGYGFLRFRNYQPSEDDVYVPAQQVRRFNLKTGDEITGDAVKFESSKSPSLIYVKRINNCTIEDALRRRSFDKLLPIYPRDRIRLGFKGDPCVSNKIIDFLCPIGKGQRGLIVAPPKAGKTTLIKSIASSIATHHPDITLMVLLIDERPEEVTDIQRSIEGADVAYSTFDQGAANHCHIAEIVLERAKRLVESGKDVVLLLDSITRLTRAFNLNNEYSGKVMSGGIDPNAFFFPKKFFGSARNIENGGSLTILATALVETGSRMDDVIFEEFKGTGNMELRLDRNLQEKRIFPAIDVLKSGTRKDEYLLSQEEINGGWIFRDLTTSSSGRIDFSTYKTFLEKFSAPSFTSESIAKEMLRYKK